MLGLRLGVGLEIGISDLNLSVS